MKNNGEPYPVEVFTGTAWEAGLLKSMLEDNEIPSVINGSGTQHLNLSPVNMSAAKIFVSSDDFDRAGEIVHDFFSDMHQDNREEE